MPTSSSADFDKNIASLVEVTDSILQGEFDHEAIVLDTEGLLQTLAQKINIMVVNLKTVESPLTSAGEQAPSVLDSAESVVELMAQSTDEVLNKSDKLTVLMEDMEAALAAGDGVAQRRAGEILTTMKGATYDIIASQSYQDVARQKMESMIHDLNLMRDWLIEVLVVLNIRKDGSAENVQKKTELLRGVKESNPAGPLKQDLVDDLLAEFGF